MTMQTNVYFEIRGQKYKADLHKNVFGPANVPIYEYDPITIIFESDDPSAVLKVERFDLEKIIALRPNTTEVLARDADSDNMFVPGEYPIEVVTSEGVYRSIFSIIPKTLSWESLTNLKKYLEGMVSGLTVNLYQKRLGINVEDVKFHQSSLDTYAYIEQSYSKIRNAFDSIVKAEETNLYKDYKVTPVTKVVDPKSIRWQLNKGLTINHNPHVPDFYYEKRCFKTLDTPDNRWMKKILVKTKGLLVELENGFHDIRKMYVLKRFTLEKQHEDLHNKLKRIEKYYGIDKSKNEITYNMVGLAREIEKIQERIIGIDDSLQKIKRFTAGLSYYLTETWLAEIPMDYTLNKPSLKVLKDPRYSCIYKFYKELNRIRRKEASVDQYSFAYKKTSKLFEYYVYIVTLNLLKELGYHWVDGWLMSDDTHAAPINDLAEGTIVKLENESHYIELAYDTKIRSYGQNKNESYFNANNNDNPDIRLALYKNDGEFVAAIVIEVKYRRYRYITNRNDGDEEIYSDVVMQLKDYLKIDHFDIVKKRKGKQMYERGVIKQSIAVYPKQDAGKPIEYIDQEHYNEHLVLLQMEPCEPTSNPFGYDNLKKLVESFLQTYGTENVTEQAIN